MTSTIVNQPDSFMDAASVQRAIDAELDSMFKKAVAEFIERQGDVQPDVIVEPTYGVSNLRAVYGHFWKMEQIKRFVRR